MKRHWFLFALAVAAAALLLAGCGGQQPGTANEQAAQAQAKAEETTQAKAKEAEQAKAQEEAKAKAAAQVPTQFAINPSALPGPRPALAAEPDLSGAKLIINDVTLAKMTADGLPSSVTDALSTMKGNSYGNPADFADSVRSAVGASADQYMETIMRDALVVDLADAVPAPEGEVSLAAGEGAMAPQLGPERTIFGIVYFDFDKSNIKPEFQQTISENAKKLMAHPNIHVQVEGHCDERGTTEYNLALGQRRADSVRNALVAAGVNPSQLTTISYGEERPVALGHNEAAWAKNRRSVLTITSQ